MPAIKVTTDIHKRIMDDRNSNQVSASDVIRALYDKIDGDPDDDCCSWRSTYHKNGVAII